MKKLNILCWMLAAALLLSGCALRTVDEMYQLPRRSETDNHLQSAIEQAMLNLDYAAPIAGDNQQTVQSADLTGDGAMEYVVFARDSVNKAIRVLIFSQVEKDIQLLSVIESHGSAFEQVEYVNVDDQPGLEMVVGRQVSDQVLRSLSVYSFASGTPEQLITANYLKFLTCDLNEDGNIEIMLIQPGETDADRGTAALYSFVDGDMSRSREVELSVSGYSIKRILRSRLHSGEPAVYVASSLDESAIITDVFALKEEKFSNISVSSESGTSVQTLRNYYVYADDIDSDGVLELPSVITMHPIRTSTSTEQQYLIRWFDLDLQGKEETKRYTFHNYVGGWYLELGDGWAERVSVAKVGSTYWFYVWDAWFEKAEPVFSVHVLSGVDREELATSENRFELLRTDAVIYAARLEKGAADLKITQEDLNPCFHLIHQAWKTGET